MTSGWTGIAPEQRRNVGGFTEGQRRYLEFHREAVFFGGEGEGRLAAWNQRVVHELVANCDLKSPIC